jgi:hypothetical protein
MDHERFSLATGVLQVARNAAYQRIALAMIRGDGKHIRRFVDDDHVLIFKDDCEGSVRPHLSLLPIALLRIVANIDLVSRLDAHAGARAWLSIHANAAVVKQASRFAVGQIRHRLDDVVGAA